MTEEKMNTLMDEKKPKINNSTPDMTEAKISCNYNVVARILAANRISIKPTINQDRYHKLMSVEKLAYGCSKMIVDEYLIAQVKATFAINLQKDLDTGNAKFIEAVQNCFDDSNSYLSAAEALFTLYRDKKGQLLDDFNTFVTELEHHPMYKEVAGKVNGAHIIVGMRENEDGKTINNAICNIIFAIFKNKGRIEDIWVLARKYLTDDFILEAIMEKSQESREMVLENKRSFGSSFSLINVLLAPLRSLSQKGTG